MIRELPEGSIWSIGCVGDPQLKMNVMSLVAGGGVRVGLEDNIWYDEEREHVLLPIVRWWREYLLLPMHWEGHLIHIKKLEKFLVSIVNRKKTMYYLKHLCQKFRHNSLIRLLFDGLKRLGIEIIPFYLVLEGLFDRKLPHLEKGFEEYDMGYLGPKDMKTISSIPVRNISEKKLLLRLKENNKCFGLKYRGELVAFTWFSLRGCTFEGYRFLLQEDEAYLFDAYTIPSFRGKGIAPYIRYQLYKELKELGRKRLYSISEYFNTPSLKVNIKLNAKCFKLCLFIQVFKKWRYTMSLKEYKVEEQKGINTVIPEIKWGNKCCA